MSHDNVDAVDKNGNKLDVDGSSAASQESLMAADSGGDFMNDTDNGGVTTPVKISHNVTLTPLKELINKSASSPRRELSPPSKQQGSSSTGTLASLSSRSPKLKVVKSKSPRKSSTPSKSPMSSPRQRSLMEMFAHGTAASASKTATQSSLSSANPVETRPTDGVSEDGQMTETSPAHEKSLVNVEVLVEDSQLGPAQSSPTRVIVDTQESMFVDDTPPNNKSGDSTAPDNDGTPLKMTCSVSVDMTDPCDMDSFLCGEASQQTVVRIDADETVSDIPLDVSDAAAQPLESNIGEVSAPSVSIDSTFCIQASSNASAGFAVDSEIFIKDFQSTAICTDNINEMPRDDTGYSQSDVIDHTKAVCLDLTQNAEVEHTQASSVNQTQLTADGTQNSDVSPTQGNYLALTQPVVLDNSQPASKMSDDIHTATGDDIPLSEMTQSHDADTCLGDAHLAALKDDDDDVRSRQSVTSSSVRFKRRRRGTGTKASAKDSKDAIHVTLQGCVKRSVTETRPTRLNLRTRSVRRLTEKLVSVGAKKIGGIPTQPQPTADPHATAMRKRGRPKGSKSHHGQTELEPRSRVPSRTVSRRSCKSRWMRVVAEETDDVATASVESERQEGRVVSDEQPFHGTKSNVEFETSEFQSGIDVRKGDEAVADLMKSVSDDQNADKAVDMNTNVEPATGEVLVTESSGKPDSGSSLDQETTVSEDDVVDSCGEPESRENLSQGMVELSAELTGEEQACSGLSEPTLTSDVITEDSQVDTMTTSNMLASELTTDNVAVQYSALDPSVDENSAINATEPSATAGDITDDVTKTQSEVEKATPPSDVGEEYQWKVPVSSVTRTHPAPTDTPTSIPRRRFTSRGSLMLERSIQLQKSAASSPPVH